MQLMFSGADAFNQYLGDWDVTNVTSRSTFVNPDSILEESNRPKWDGN